MTTLLDVEHLSVRLPTASGPITIVDDVSYQVEQGKVFGVAGESGSGKTISLLALMRLLLLLPFHHPPTQQTLKHINVQLSLPLSLRRNILQ